ncbi:MAG: DUF4012 domain-containing protein [Actinomycetia bacterium]|nr:DUF4012 domain-containing protein [Actinomycetes bacterium]
MAGEVRVTLRMWSPARVGRVLLLLGLILLGVWAVQVYATARSLQAHLVAAEALASDNPLLALADPEAVGQLLTGLRADVVTLQRQTGGLVRIAPALRWLPKVGPLLGDAPVLLDMGDGLTEAGVILWDAFAPALQAGQSGEGDLLESFAVALEQAQPHLGEARAAVQRAQEVRAQLTVESLPGRLQEPLGKLDAVLPWLDDGLAVAQVAPDLLGMREARTYLLLALNEDELRPGGGFITGVGEVRLQAGHIVTMTFRDSYAADDFSLPYPDPPEPLRRFMGLDLWVFRDSNWSPDFPTSARQALDLYRPGYPVEVAGVAAVDQTALRALLNALGPITVRGETVTGDSVQAFIYEAWTPEEERVTLDWLRQRKDFMGELATAILGQVESAPDEIDWLVLGQAVLQLFESRHLQFTLLIDSPATAVLAERGWDGSLATTEGDFLAVIEANVGYNKASCKIERAFAYEVDLSQQPLQSQLTLTYTHTSQVDIPCVAEARYDFQYEKMMDRCYWAYLRLYLPEGARLVKASRHLIPAAAMWDGRPWDGEPLLGEPERDHAVVEQAFLLPMASQVALHFVYELPAGILQEEAGGVFHYHLDLQKQAGLDAVPVDISLRLPSNAVVLDLWPQPTSQQGRRLWYQLDLKEDSSLSVRYRTSEGDEP